MTHPQPITDKQWRQSLTPEQYAVLRQCGTEAPFSGAYWDTHDSGVYRCVGCGYVLFSSDHKFDSGTGWPSFWQSVDDAGVVERPDNTLGQERIEVTCSQCGGHLGHIFPDGPKPTGRRYCINSAALKFDHKK